MEKVLEQNLFVIIVVIGVIITAVGLAAVATSPAPQGMFASSAARVVWNGLSASDRMHVMNTVTKAQSTGEVTGADYAALVRLGFSPRDAGDILKMSEGCGSSEWGTICTWHVEPITSTTAPPTTTTEDTTTTPDTTTTKPSTTTIPTTTTNPTTTTITTTTLESCTAQGFGYQCLPNPCSSYPYCSSSPNYQCPSGNCCFGACTTTTTTTTTIPKSCVCPLASPKHDTCPSGNEATCTNIGLQHCEDSNGYWYTCNLV